MKADREIQPKRSKKLLLIINPVSGKGLGKKYTFGLVSFFTREGFLVTVHPTEAEAKSNVDFIEKNVANYDLIVCCGGDGTLNESISGIMKSKSNVPMGYIPLGTTNDFAKTLGISTSPLEAASSIIKSKIKKIDCGLFNGKTFVYVAAIGAFTQASYGASPAEKRYLGTLAYVLKGIESLATLKPFHLKAKINNEIIEGNYLYASVSNTTSLGGFFKLDPSKVKIDDGIFEVVLIKAPDNLTEKGKLVTGLLTESLNSEYVDLFYTSDIKIKLDSPMAWSLDGENGGEHKDIIIKNLSGSINMLGIK
ncbi:MAG: diacylglycerol kinase family lipid kinase [Ruminococcaceae bacterium]|nr:diacylglycerol kinase family lipid kinase [Oscillospiraceae bacterium]